MSRRQAGPPPSTGEAGAPRPRAGSAAQRSVVLGALRKVPEITIYFWIIKLLTTALGESTSDYLVYHINPYVAVLLGGAGLVAALGVQLAVRRYVTSLYWLAVLMVAIAGTMAADVVHIVLGVPYVDSTLALAVILAAIFAVWYASEKTLSIHSIVNPRRELFYWATVMATFALGTAAGDMTAFSLNLGFFSSVVLFAVVIAVPALGYRLAGLNAIVAFWFAYIVTRPLGASVADWLGKPRSLRGLALGDGPVSLALALALVGLVAYIAITGKELPADERGTPLVPRPSLRVE